MRVFWVTMVFVLFGLFGMGYAQQYIRTSVQEILLSMEDIEKALYAEDAEKAETTYHASCEKYVHMLNKLTLFMHHNELTEVRVILGRLGIYIRDKNWSDARASFAEAKIVLMAVAEQERIELKNIF